MGIIETRRLEEDFKVFRETVRKCAGVVCFMRMVGCGCTVCEGVLSGGIRS